jgi:hypothetical protein
MAPAPRCSLLIAFFRSFGRAHLRAGAVWEPSQTGPNSLLLGVGLGAVFFTTVSTRDQ